TQDDLTVIYIATDPDGDALTFTRKWRRNGADVPGQTGPTFPNALTTRRDQIEVILTASDGQTQTSASAQATIEDSPAILTANAPPVVDAGTVVHFQVSASDPDGDPSGTPVLLYGPYGMSLTAAGMVSWTAELPLFDQQLDVNWAVGIPGTESNLAG